MSWTRGHRRVPSGEVEINVRKGSRHTMISKMSRLLYAHGSVVLTGGDGSEQVWKARVKRARVHFHASSLALVLSSDPRFIL